MVKQVDWDCLEQKAQLGYGSFSNVYKAIWTMDGDCQKEIAVKVFRDSSSKKYDEREIRHLSEVNHENIVTIYGISRNKESNTVILLEYADGGTLYDYIYNQSRSERVDSYEYLKSLGWMHQFAKAMDYLHKRNIIHRDLKPQNLLLFNDFQTLKIADFGTVTEMMTETTKMIGTAAYMAPEVCEGENYKFGSDVYSYGITFWEVLARKKPFSYLANNNPVTVRCATVAGKRPLLEELMFEDDVNQERFKTVKQMLEKFWDGDHNNRPTMEIVVSCFVIESGKVLDLDIGSLFENNQLKIRYAQYAPPEREWYHGLLDKKHALNRLRKFNKQGSYLVHYENRFHYYLKYINENQEIRNLSIYVNNGNYTINNEMIFSSLNDLVGYYSDIAEFDYGERLQIPVPPSQPVLDKNRVIAILKYTEKNFADELNFAAGDIFTVHNDIHEDWLWVTAHGSGEQGMIYYKFVKSFDGTVDVNTMYPWFHPHCTRQEADSLLQSAGSGDFLVRPSEESPGDYLLCVSGGSLSPSEFRIENKDVYYNMNDRSFDCLQMLIDFYRRKAIVVGQSLREPVYKLSQSNLKLEEVSDEEAKSIYDELHKAMASLQRKLSMDTLHHGNLNLWNDKTGSWMNVHMKLMKRNMVSRLYIYETLQHIKHIAFLEITHAHLYECPNQLWIRSYCFQIYERAGKITTLQALTKVSYQEWKKVLSECINKPLPYVEIFSEPLSDILGYKPDVSFSPKRTTCSAREILYTTTVIGDLSLWSTETESWIDVSINLRSGGSSLQLFIYDTTDNRHCESVDLTKASIYKCHKSLWNRLYCFQICPIDREIINLSASNLESFKACMTKLKSVRISQPPNSSLFMQNLLWKFPKIL